MMDIHGKECMAFRSKIFAMKRIEVSESIRNGFVTKPIAQKIVHIIFTQMNAKQGIAKHGERAEGAIFKELNQLDVGAKAGNPVVVPQDPNLSSEKGKREAL